MDDEPSAGGIEGGGIKGGREGAIGGVVAKCVDDEEATVGGEGEEEEVEVVEAL